MRVREPFNAGSHFIGLLVAAAGAPLLAFSIYGATTP